MSNLNLTNVLGQINAVTIEISTWSGGASLKKDDIGVDLPDRAFSLGRKYLIAPERLKAFPTIRTRARNRCLKVGTRFLGGFALPADQAVMDDLVADLEAMRHEFEDKKNELLREFQQAVDEWISEPEIRPYEALIRSAIPPLATIEKRFQFDYAIFQVGSPVAAATSTLERETMGLSNSLFAEVAETAEKLYQSFLKRNDKGLEKPNWTFSTRTVEAVRGIRDKLKGLEFVDCRIPPIVDEIDRTIRALPSTGNVLEGRHMRDLYALLIVLSSEQRIFELGAGLLQIADVERQEFRASAPEPQIIETIEPAEELAVDVDSEPFDDDLDLDLDDLDLELPLELPVVRTPAIDMRDVCIGF